jgi:hypothetical protein
MDSNCGGFGWSTFEKYLLCSEAFRQNVLKVVGQKLNPKTGFAQSPKILFYGSCVL